MTNVPANVFWDESQMGFYDYNDKSMGGKFFDEWKERRGEFPPRRPKRRKSSYESSKGNKEVVEDPIPEGAIPVGDTDYDFGSPFKMVTQDSVDDVLLAVARLRKQSFDAHMAVGFTREEALQLCIHDAQQS